MSRPEVLFHDVETNKITVREMNDEEFEQFEKDRIEHVATVQSLNEAKVKREALLDRLGITEEEAKLLLS